MAKIVMYTSTHCAYCVRAKALLDEKGVAYDVINIDEDDTARQTMMEITGRRTVPQIIIDDNPIGGSDDLYALDTSGELDKLLGNFNA